jgi:hypothetical protein
VVSLSKFNFFINKYYFLFGAILIAAGIFMSFFGNKFVNPVIYGVTTLAVFIVLGNSLFDWIMANSNHQWVQWLFIAALFALANLCAAFLVRFRKIAVAIMAGFGGALIAATFTITFVIQSKFLWWLLVLGVGIAFALISLKLEELILMFCTSFIGSYLSIRGISLYAGGFPYET